jgi:serine/threonine protein kinase
VAANDSPAALGVPQANQPVPAANSAGHAAGVVHRVLTPKNVLVVSGGSIKIADFGIAAQSLMSRAVRFDAFNPDFAPPIFERWLAADDVFHCGQVYAFLLAGRADALLKTEDVRKLKCSPETKAVIQRCIDARRRRYESATEMLNALESSEMPHPWLEACGHWSASASFSLEECESSAHKPGVP